MTSPLGQTFAPTGSADDEISRKPNAAQQAIQVLSMRLPRVRGARSISPLLGEPGSAARRETGGFSADSAVLQTLMRAQAPSAPMGSMPGAGGGDPMAAAMAALGGGMMNAGPSVIPGAGPSSQSMPPYQPPAPPMIGAGGGSSQEPTTPARPDREPPVYGELPEMPRERPREPRETWHGAPGGSGVDVSYGGSSPVDPSGNPNPGYTGNTGINGGRPPAAPQPPMDIPVPDLPNGGPPTGGGGVDPRMLRALISMLGGGAR